MGYVYDDVTLSLLYSAVDVMVVPSRQDNLPQTGIEAQTCGLPSVVEHESTGYLARPFDTDDLAHGIKWILAEDDRWQRLSSQARQRAVQLWSPDVVAEQYLAVYEAVCHGY